jgi:hypothetical protein
MKKTLTMTGLLRVLVHLLGKQPDKKLIISESVVEKSFIEKIAVFHDPATRTFRLQLIPSRKEGPSLLIAPGMN